MNEITLTFKQLKELGCPFNALGYKTISHRLNDSYEVRFKYNRKIYETEIWDDNLDDANMENEEFDCLEIKK